MLKRTLEITFKSDWQIGSGAGIPGSVDRQVLRDTDGLPYIPAKTLTGILRDAAEWLVDNSEKDKAYLKRLFGCQIPDHGGDKKEQHREGLLSVRPARIERAVRNALREDKELKKALFIVQPHVKIDADTGRAKNDHLFFIELVRSDVYLEAELFLDEKVAEDKACQIFLDDVIKAVRRIGGKRRRGAGRCSLNWKENDWQRDTSADIKIQDALAVKEDGWVRIPMTLEALEMLQIHRETLGNAVETRDYIPGYLVLPHIASATGVDVRTFLAKGDLQVSDFLPGVNGEAPMPTPHCLFKPKMGGGEIKNRILAKADTEEQLVGLRTGYVVSENDKDGKGNKLTLGKTDELLTVRMHNTIHDDAQRPNEDVGGVFSYGAVQRGTRFRGELRCTKAVYDALKGRSFSGDMRLGISKKDDYGRARVTCAAAEEMKQEDIHLHKGDLLVVYLESDVLVRDKMLAYSASPEDLKRAIEKELPFIRLELIKSADLITSIGRGRRHEGWQTKWALPRPSLVALQAGSVYVFRVASTWCQDSIEKLALRGIGERRAEGFGRVQFNPSWLLADNISMEEKALQPSGETNDNPTVSDDVLLQKLRLEKAKRLIRRQARQKAYKMIGDGENRKVLGSHSGPDSPSQWGSLRAMISRIDDAFDKGSLKILEWADVRYKEKYKKQERPDQRPSLPSKDDPWPTRRQEKWGKLRNALLDLVWKKDRIWQYYPEVDNSVKDELWGFAVRTLLDYICEAVFDNEGKKDKNKRAPEKATPAQNQRRG